MIDPAQDDVPSNYFNTVLYTGNGSTQSITGVGFQPDLIWGKNRSTTGYHQLFDVIRGVTHNLASNSTDAEGTITSLITSFDSDGFSVGNNTDLNQSSTSIVAWNWLAGNKTPQGNTDDNGYGDFYYAPPSGYLALCTANLPGPMIVTGKQ